MRWIKEILKQAPEDYARCWDDYQGRVWLRKLSGLKANHMQVMGECIDDYVDRVRPRDK